MSRLAIVLGLLIALVVPASAQPLTRTEKLARGAGKALGLRAGIAVTGGLAPWKKWNAPMRDKAGRIQRLDVRGYEFTLRERHRSVIGPKLRTLAKNMKTATRLQRLGYNFVQGLSVGANVAPRIEGRFEADVAASLHGH